MKANFIKQETSTSGTGALTLASVAGWGTFAAKFSQNALFKYGIKVKSSGVPVEVGWGYLDGSGDLVRSIIESTNSSGTVTDGGTAASLAATVHEVVCAETAGVGLSAAPGVWSPGTGVSGYGDAHAQGSSGTIALVADTVYVLPFIAAVDRMVDAIAVSVSTAGAAGKQIKAAIYTIASDGKPGVKVAESIAVAVDTTGLKTMTFASPVRVPSRYYVCLICDGAPTVLGYGTGAIGSFAMGYTAALAVISSATHAGATGLAFPGTWTLTAILGNAIRPAAVARCV